MTKNVVLIIAIVLFIVAIAGWTFAVNERYTIFQRDREIADLFVISTAQAQIQTTSIARESNNSTAQAQIQTTSEAQQSLLQIATEAFSSVTQTANIQSTLIAGKSKTIADLQHSIATQSKEISDFEDTGVCDQKPSSIDYTSNSTVSASLKKWIEDTQGSIETAEWDVIWSDSKAAVHKLTGEYLWVYVVYFDEPKYEQRERIFDVRFHCFLDP